MSTRRAFRAGTFYPDNKKEVENQLGNILADVENTISTNAKYGGIVPHAGWVFSGSTAMKVYYAIKNNYGDDIDTFIIFGAVHVPGVNHASLYPSGFWQTPLGEVPVDEDLAKIILKNTSIQRNESAHSMEHSIEVQIPIIKYLFPNSKILPIMTPPKDKMKNIGMDIGKIIKSSDNNIMIIGSTDLTHYGPRFGMTQGGLGKEGLEWMKKNDRRIIEIMVNMNLDKIISETQKNRNACGGGAILASLSAFKELGIEKGMVLGYTTSYDERPFGEPSDAVGYAGIVY